MTFLTASTQTSKRKKKKPHRHSFPSSFSISQPSPHVTQIDSPRTNAGRNEFKLVFCYDLSVSRSLSPRSEWGKDHLDFHRKLCIRGCSNPGYAKDPTVFFDCSSRKCEEKVASRSQAKRISGSNLSLFCKVLRRGECFLCSHVMVLILARGKI